MVAGIKLGDAEVDGDAATRVCLGALVSCEWQQGGLDQASRAGHLEQALPYSCYFLFLCSEGLNYLIIVCC